MPIYVVIRKEQTSLPKIQTLTSCQKAITLAKEPA